MIHGTVITIILIVIITFNAMSINIIVFIKDIIAL